MKIHRLKTWPNVFEATIAGLKTWEFRKADRDFEVGDHLELVEWNPGLDGDGELDASQRGYSGRVALVKVTYLMEGGDYGIPSDYVVMSTEVIG